MENVEMEEVRSWRGVVADKSAAVHVASLSTLPEAGVQGTHLTPAAALPHHCIVTNSGSKRHVRKRLVRFLLRLDICLALFFAVIAIAVAFFVRSYTDMHVTQRVMDTWRTLHNIRLATVTKRYDQDTERVFRMATALLSLYSQDGFVMESEDTLATLCSLLVRYDPRLHFRGLTAGSETQMEATSCFHGDASVGPPETLTGFVSHKHIINATFYVDPTTYRFERPLRTAALQPAAAQNITATAPEYYLSEPIYQLTRDYYNGLIDEVDPRAMWVQNRNVSHLIYFIYPAGLAMRGLTTAAGYDFGDAVQVRLDARRLGQQVTTQDPEGFRLAIMNRYTLLDDTPTILANNWGQETLLGANPYTFIGGELSVYLNISSVSDALMKRALTYVDFAALATEGYKHARAFAFNGAPATVTAWSYRTKRGLILPLVMVSAMEPVAGPYHSMLIATAVTLLLATVLLIAAVWWLFNYLLTEPLRDVADVMETELRVGSAYREGWTELRGCCHTDVRQRNQVRRQPAVQLSDVVGLRTVCRSAATQLRYVDAFLSVPQDFSVAAAGSAERSHSPDDDRDLHTPDPTSLAQHLSTVVYISTRPRSASTSNTPAATQHPPLSHPSDRAASDVTSGPFPSPASLAAFVVAVQELCRRHHGTAHRVCPDGCVLHFNRAVRRVLPTCTPDEAAAAAVAPAAPAAARTRHGVPAAQSRPPPAPTPMQRAAAKDARDAAAFALALTRWVDSRGGAGGAGGAAGGGGDGAMPDVRALLDTALFACGPYRPLGSEQTLQVALGRDVQRDVGGVPRRIGVRVAMTEETAVRVRDAASGGGAADAEADADTDAAEHAEGRAGSDGAGGVRAIPVEALRTGRAGLDAQSLVLYEALPGRVAGDAAWQAYARCCDDGFALMVRGDYAGARRAYGGVADIADLEPGLLPPSLSREAARSDVRGGAVSTQVARLVRQCEYCVELNLTEPLAEVKRCLHAIQVEMPRRTARTAPAPARSELRNSRSDLGQGSAAAVALPAPSGETPSTPVVPSAASFPPLFTDNRGCAWRTAKHPANRTAASSSATQCTAMSVEGERCDVAFFHLQSAVRSLAASPWPLASRACDSRKQHVKASVPLGQEVRLGVEALFGAPVKRLRNPHIAHYVGYSYVSCGDAAVAVLTENGGDTTLHDVLHRYAGGVEKPAQIRFAVCILRALNFLHKNGTVHGNLRPDCIYVGADGRCRVGGFWNDYALAHRVLHIKRSCYVSPEVAAGRAPTPASDVFTYGLVMLQVLTGKLPWMWAPVKGEGPVQSPDALIELAAAGEQPFYDAVAERRVVPALPRSGVVESSAYSTKTLRLFSTTLAWDVEDRLTVSALMQLAETHAELRNIDVDFAGASAPCSS